MTLIFRNKLSFKVTGTATISVIDVNDNTPACSLSKFYGTVTENSAVDTTVIDLSSSCNDGDHTSSGAFVALNYA